MNGAGPVRMAFDDQVFVLQRRGGISRYYTELLREFEQDPALGVRAAAPFRYVVTQHLHDYAPRRFTHPTLPRRLDRAAVLHAMNTARFARPQLLTRQVLHHTYYLPIGLRTPATGRVCTVYDMIPEHFPELHPYGNPHRAKDAYVAACDAVLCISQSTKDDVLRHYGSLDKPVVVTPLGVSSRYFDARAATPDVPYVLFVGQRSGYKNFDVLLRAFADVAGQVQLLCVGGPPFSDEETLRIAALGLDGRVSRRPVGDAELPDVYASAVALVFPSRYEGFGLPTVEAFAAGCPVVLAETPCSVEVGGDAARFFAPDAEDELAAILDELVRDAGAREKWREAGRRRARDFSWRRTAELTAGVYRDVERATAARRRRG